MMTRHLSKTEDFHDGRVLSSERSRVDPQGIRFPCAIAGLALARGRRRERSRLRRELWDLRQQGELDRTLIDSGIAPSDLYRLMRSHPRTREQLAEMMRRLGIDRAALPRRPTVVEALRAMEWRCGECADWRKCRTWLDAGDAPGSYRAFCPNAETLDQLRTSGASFRKPCGILAELAAARGSDGTRD